MDFNSDQSFRQKVPASRFKKPFASVLLKLLAEFTLARPSQGRKGKIKMVFAVVCGLLGLAGVYGIFTGNILLILIGGCADLLENVVGLLFKGQKNVNFLILFGVGGIIYAAVTKTPFWLGIMTGLTLECAVMSLLTLAMGLYLTKIRKQQG